MIYLITRLINQRFNKRQWQIINNSLDQLMGIELKIQLIIVILILWMIQAKIEQNFVIKQAKIYLQSLQKMSQPNSRFNQYTEIVKNNEIVGFKLDDNDFQFLFDKNGGWYDEQGRYYNANSIQCTPPEESSDGDSQDEQKPGNQEAQLQKKVLSLQIRDGNERVEAIRNLNQILESYPEGQEIVILVSLQPSSTDSDKLIEQFLNTRLNQKLTVQNGEVIGVFSEQLAVKIIELEGSKLQNITNNTTLYIDIQLFDSVEISVKMRKSELETKLNELNYKRNIDYANVSEEKTQNGDYICFIEIRMDIENQLKEDLQFKVETQ